MLGSSQQIVIKNGINLFILIILSHSYAPQASGGSCPHTRGWY
jgi:hypothetical protein